MKLKLITSLFIASLGGVAFAGTQTCTDKATGYELKINFPAGGGMGVSHGTGRLSQSGKLLETLRCTFTSGITTTLDCGTRTGYFASAVSNLSVLPLSNKGVPIATLTCK